MNTASYFGMGNNINCNPKILLYISDYDSTYCSCRSQISIELVSRGAQFIRKIKRLILKGFHYQISLKYRRSLNVDMNNYTPKQPKWAEKNIKNTNRYSFTDLNDQEKRGSTSTVATLATMSTDFYVQDDYPIEEMTSSSDESESHVKFKTEMCKNWSILGKCNYGNKCQFAHGQNEMINRQCNQKYKSKLCRSFHQDYVCFYGARCQFIHESRSVDQIRKDYKSQTSFYQPASSSLRLKSFQLITRDWKSEIPLQECIKLWKTMILLQINISSSSD